MANLYGTLGTDGHIAAVQSGDVDLVAQSSGDIVVSFTTSSGGQMTFPVKSLQVRKNVTATRIYGTGSLQAQRIRYSQIKYSGNFSVNTWLSKTDKMKLDKLLFDPSSGIPRYFAIVVLDRAGGSDNNLARPILQLTGCVATESGQVIGSPDDPIAVNYSFEAMMRSPP